MPKGRNDCSEREKIDGKANEPSSMTGSTKVLSWIPYLVAMYFIIFGALAPVVLLYFSFVVYPITVIGLNFTPAIPRVQVIPSQICGCNGWQITLGVQVPCRKSPQLRIWMRRFCRTPY